MKHNYFFGPFAMAALGAVACGDAASAGRQADGDGDQVAARAFAASGAESREAGAREVGSDAQAEVGSGTAAACTAIAAPATSSLPHVAAGGAPAQAVVGALAELLAAEQPPLAAATRTYAARALSCSTVFTPRANGSACTLDLSIDGGAPVTIGTRDAELAGGLLGALSDAGADECNDFAHGEFLHLANVALDVASGTLEFDDASQYSLPPSPNVRASGPEGAAVVAAMEAANINDCDPSRTAFIVCNRLTESPACSVTFFQLEEVGGSELVDTCSVQPAVGATLQLGAPEALALWNAIVGAAAASGFTPLHGTIEGVTLINAQHFTWDGASLGFVLTADHPSPPPPPGP